jgi:hypothetical protein
LLTFSEAATEAMASGSNAANVEGGRTTTARMKAAIDQPRPPVFDARFRRITAISVTRTPMRSTPLPMDM